MRVPRLGDQLLAAIHYERRHPPGPWQRGIPLARLGMAGFLVIGLSIPHAFGSPGTHGRDGLALGLGYLVVVCVHSGLYLRANRNIGRILPFNLTSSVLVIIAGLTPAMAAAISMR